MSAKTGIEWTDSTWNPIAGCSRVSPGCDHCYAIPQANRMKGTEVYLGTVDRRAGRLDWTGRINTAPDRLDQPLRWPGRRRIFVNSMSDLFHKDVPIEFTREVLAVMARADRHVFQVLTKRPQRMAELVSAEMPDPVPNIWWGTSIELDRYAFRADWLRDTPAAVRWLSLEPLLGPVPSLDLSGIDWVVVGGESHRGRGVARPMDLGWVRDVRDRCVDAGVPFLFKQWGNWVPVAGGGMVEVGKHRAGRQLDGRLWDEYPA